MQMEYNIEEMRADDWDAVREIYRAGIETGEATFETAIPQWKEWDADHLAECRLLARAGDDVLGWAALSPISSREVYRGVAEVSIYIAPDHWGQGVGKALLTALIEASERAGIWTLQSSLFPENKASVALHKSCGFREVGVRERIAQLDGVWRDDLLLERRI